MVELITDDLMLSYALLKEGVDNGTLIQNHARCEDLLYSISEGHWNLYPRDTREKLSHSLKCGCMYWVKVSQNVNEIKAILIIR